jgi:hypothetical protein
MKQSFKTLAVILIICLISANLMADEKIKLKLHQPPPNKLGVADMWNLELDNTTGKGIKIYLTGTATEEKDGLIVDGKSKIFTVKPGKKTYGYQDFRDGEVSWKNKTYEEAIIRTGNIKSGLYMICVTAYFESGEVAAREECITQVIENVSAGVITLISPADGEKVEDPGTLLDILCMWIGTGLKGPYTLRIIEIKGDQSPEVAMKENLTFFEKKEITTTTFQYPVTAPKFERGKKYAWQVNNNETTSAINSFMINVKEDSIVSVITDEVSYTVELIQNNKSIVKTMTDTSGNFSLKNIPDGEYGLKITTQNGETPKFILMTIGDVGIIICCCPGPPCDEPYSFYIGSGEIFNEPTKKALYFKNNKFQGTISPWRT